MTSKKLFSFLDFILTNYFLIFQGVRFKIAMFNIGQYQQLVESLEEMKRCNPNVSWPSISDKDRAPMKVYKGDGSFAKV